MKQGGDQCRRLQVEGMASAKTGVRMHLESSSRVGRRGEDRGAGAEAAKMRGLLKGLAFLLAVIRELLQGVKQRR